jgi:hypothetical protein
MQTDNQSTARLSACSHYMVLLFTPAALPAQPYTGAQSQMHKHRGICRHAVRVYDPTTTRSSAGQLATSEWFVGDPLISIVTHCFWSSQSLSTYCIASLSHIASRQSLACGRSPYQLPHALPQQASPAVPPGPSLLHRSRPAVQSPPPGPWADHEGTWTESHDAKPAKREQGQGTQGQERGKGCLSVSCRSYWRTLRR